MSKTYLVLILIFLVGCTTPTVTAEPPEVLSTVTPTLVPAAPTVPDAPQANDGPVFLTIWIPPDFDPANGAEEGQIFQKRLDEFMARRSNIDIETRVKAVDGPGGIIDTLTTAGAAAPLALPDLVLLPAHALESAAIKGLLHPFDGLTDILDDPDWYDYARQLSHVQNSTFGIPFMGDALMMVYRPSIVGQQPETWAATLALQEPLVFPAAESNSLVTLAHYQSLGGAVLDEENRPTLESIQLTEVFSYYQQASVSGVMPFWITPFETDAQIWESYQNQQTHLMLTWASSYLDNLPADSNGAALPTSDGVPYTLANGWAWALASPDIERQAIATQLAEFLSTTQFLGQWSAAAGYLPPRPSALSLWENVSQQALLGPIIASAQLIPPRDTLTTLGPILQTATVEILKAEQTDPLLAAEAAIAKITAP